MSLLSVHNLAIDAAPLSLIDGVTLVVEPGEIVALVGESGSGKSLTALAIMGLLGEGLSVENGTIAFDKTELTALPEGELSRLRGNDLAMIFQEPVSSLNPLVPVGAQVAESLIVHGKAKPQAAMRQAIEMLRRVGIPEPERRATQLPTEFSGGMCQRVMIAAALISRPRLLIADEPTTALDVTIQAQILELMRELAGDAGTAILLITHDMGVVAELAERVCVMYAGRVVEQGRVDRVFAAPRHPYTRMLLRTIPRLDEPPKKELFTIKGNVPSPRNWPQGCRFRTRCDWVSEKCNQRPDLEGTEHRFACFHTEETPV